MVRGNAVYESQYLLGTSIARRLLQKHILTLQENGANALAHGATGKEMISAGSNSPFPR